MQPTLIEAYRSEEFKSLADQLLSLISAAHEASITGTHTLNNWQTPDESLKFWSEGNKDIQTILSEVIDRSIKLHHPHCMGHQVGIPAPAMVIGEWLSAYLNNGMAIYEMGMASSAMEKVVTDWLCRLFGFKQGSGVLSSGGSLGNLTALLAARQKKLESWDQGTSGQYAVMVSKDAHYCVERAVKIMGWGDKGIIKLDVDQDRKADVTKLQQAFDQALSNGITPIAIVGCSCSTGTGAFDDLSAMADFAAANELWLHVDAAHGGASIFHDDYKHLLSGIERADSLVLDLHKMMLTPAINTAILYKEERDSYLPFAQEASYLWDDDDSLDWFNIGKRTVECTKKMMCLPAFIGMHHYHPNTYKDYISQTYGITDNLATILEGNDNFEVHSKPQCNIICYRYKFDSDLNERNAALRKAVLHNNNFYIVQTTIDGDIWLRNTMMNPFTNEEHLLGLIEELEQTAMSL